MTSSSVLFEELVQAFSLDMVPSTSSSSSLATFCQAKHREAMLSHFPAHIGSHFRVQLASSSFNGLFLFDDEVLLTVLTASREDSAVSTNIALTKAVSFAFGAGKSDWKASSDRTSMPPLPLLPQGAKEEVRSLIVFVSRLLLCPLPLLPCLRRGSISLIHHLVGPPSLLVALQTSAAVEVFADRSHSLAQ